MYRFIRRIHLFTGLSLLVFVIMYFATGFVMVHEDWFPRKEAQKTVRTEPLEYAGDRSPASFSAYLQQRFGLAGKRQPGQQGKDGSWKFNYAGPGFNYEAVVPAVGKEVKITRSDSGTLGMLHGFHRLHGYGGGTFYDVWAFIYDLASASLILFALTGIYMWYTTAQKKLAGWICLALSFGYAAAMVLYLVCSP
jgi:hypothetical protein